MLRLICAFNEETSAPPNQPTMMEKITSNGSVLRHIRHEYGNNVTNNQAEYQTLIEALKWLQNEIGDSRKSASIAVFGDSLLVINQLQGKWKVKNEGLRPLVREAIQLISGFGHLTLNWHARSNSVKRLGH